MGKRKKLIGLDLYADNHRKNPQVTFQAQLTDIDVCIILWLQLIPPQYKCPLWKNYSTNSKQTEMQFQKIVFDIVH